MPFDRSEDLLQIFDPDDLGFEAEYTPPGGVAVGGLWVHLDEGVEQLDPGSGEVLDQADTITFLRSQVPHPAESGEVLLVAVGRTFRVLSVVRQNQDEVVVEVREQ